MFYFIFLIKIEILSLSGWYSKGNYTKNILLRKKQLYNNSQLTYFYISISQQGTLFILGFVVAM